MSKPLLTVTLNPALDLTGHIGQIRVGSVNVVKSGSLHPAGKGINVARVLRDFGADVAVTGILGAGNQQAFRDLFAQCGLTDHFMAVPGDTRINVKMVEENGEVTDLNFPGVAVADDELKEFEARLLRQAEQYEYVVVAGSLPRGISAEASRDLIAKLQQKGAKVLFDSSKEALVKGLEAKPFLIKPNEVELAEWAGQPLDTEEALRAQAEKLCADGIANVVISRGADGVLWCADGECWSAKPPRMEVVSTVGAGDSMVAGFAWGLSQGMDKEQILRIASAVSALAVTQIGVGVPNKQQLADMMARIDVKRLA
ncbi:MAG: 1-phosphofructokinase [Tolumonas sp.]|nr:1-phosphofructokinase [Tolumonas sp.]